MVAVFGFDEELSFPRIHHAGNFASIFDEAHAHDPALQPIAIGLSTHVAHSSVEYGIVAVAFPQFAQEVSIRTYPHSGRYFATVYSGQVFVKEIDSSEAILSEFMISMEEGLTAFPTVETIVPGVVEIAQAVFDK